VYFGVIFRKGFIYQQRCDGPLNPRSLWHVIMVGPEIQVVAERVVYST
jgi:hypothetical protein